MSEIERADRIRMRARAMGADLVVLPLRIDEKTGKAVYAESTVFLVKRLNAAGVPAVYLDDPADRTFVSQNSAVLTALGSIGLGIVGSAAYDGLKALVSRIWRHEEAEVNLAITDATESTPEQWTLTGTHAEVVATIERMRERRLLPGAQGWRSPQDDVVNMAQVISPTPVTPWSVRELAAVDEHLDEADKLAGEAEVLLASGPENFDEADRVAIRALRSYQSALNWAEDTDREEEAHRRMDAAGRRKRELFGCTIAYENGTYIETCPVSLGHVRVGLSVGGTAERVCSLCDEDISECEHDPTQTYLVPGGTTPQGYCRVCMEKDCEQHKPHLMYQATPGSVVTSMTVDEISFVARPAFRDARIQRQDIELSRLQRELGDQFRPGMVLNCDRCLRDCGGLTQMNGVRPTR